MPERADPAARFWPKVNKDGPVPEYAPDLGPCWLWTAATDGGFGYGAFADGTKTDAGNPRVVSAHRWAWMAENGLVPDGLELDHLCRVPACVRPSHLEAVTHRENLLRAPWTCYDAMRAKTHCPSGHAYAEHGYFDPSAGANGARRCRPCKRATAREATRRYRERKAREKAST